MRVAVYGAGGHGKVVADILEASGHDVVGFIDDVTRAPVLGFLVAGSAAELPSFDGLVVAIGDNELRREKFLALRSEGFHLITAMHPSAVVSPYARLGAGCVICAGAILNAGAFVGDNVIVNTGADVGHDAELGDHVHVGPGAHLGGHVCAAEGAFLGIGVMAIPGVTIGDWAICGAGAVVVRDVPPGVTAVGVPARPVGSALPHGPPG